MSDMLLEVDEALRAQQLKALWDKFGQWLIGAAVVAVVGTAIGVTWYEHTNKVLSEQTGQLMSVLQGSNSAKELADLTAKTDAPLKGVTELYQAQKLEQTKDLKGAQEVYKNMTEQHGIPAAVSDMARIHYVRLGMVQNAKPDELLPVLEPLTKTGGNFHASAMELKAMLLLQENKNKDASEIFTALAADETAPDTIRKRAKTMIGYEAK